MSLNYDEGALIVFLHSAHKLAGKQSQDPYASLFLIEDDNGEESSSSSSSSLEDEENHDPDPKTRYQWHRDQTVIYQLDHEKTSVYKENLNPEFKDMFNVHLPEQSSRHPS